MNSMKQKKMRASEDQQPDKQNKNDTASDDDKGSDEKSYEDSAMFSEDDYEGIMYLQVVSCIMNEKARIPDSWILLDSHSFVYAFMNKKLLKNIRYAKKGSFTTL